MRKLKSAIILVLVFVVSIGIMTLIRFLSIKVDIDVFYYAACFWAGWQLPDIWKKLDKSL